MWLQRQLTLPSVARGFHLITPQIQQALPELSQLQAGLLQVFIQHTSASLTLNENADPTVRSDMERYLNRAISDGASYFQHNDEGDDDMPAHIKASLLGASVLLPVSQGRLALGTWQGIWLGEHRNHGGQRHLLLTLQGE
ncbi:secondary thiamine-phosphate synthase enzyme YjbQ [Gallaecimonas sp. GXIMD1310]|uniref:secondary thiamine-phosphate synthase enzyme YjbQ n=1 Tax=Gallaecimonas sp. GXIMD1310 TaxID=3131926 RepID=UPI00324BAA13